VAKTKKRPNPLLQEAELILGVPDFRDSVDKDELPVNFILKRGRDRAEAKARKELRAPAARRPAKKKR
jgi:hypothetical protein